MVKVRYVQKNGNQLIVGLDDGTRSIALPTTQGMWTVSGVDPGPGPGPGPSTGDIAWPFNKNVITSGYGPRTGGAGSFHEGVDFSGGKAVPGADILCAMDGKVAYSGTNYGFGNYVLVFHGTIDNFDFYTNYGHMSSRAVSTGATVAQGDKLGTLGSTGVITGPCLHWETHKCKIGAGVVWNLKNDSGYRTAVDPVTFMSQYGSNVILNA